MSKFDITETLKRLRLQSGMTANEVGALVGRSGKTVNAWEHGNGQPDAEMLIKLSKIYNVDNILEEFRAKEIPAKVEESIQLSSHERDLIIAYRSRPNLQNAVDILLGVEKKEAESGVS